MFTRWPEVHSKWSDSHKSLELKGSIKLEKIYEDDVLRNFLFIWLVSQPQQDERRLDPSLLWGQRPTNMKARPRHKQRLNDPETVISEETLQSSACKQLRLG